MVENIVTKPLGLVLIITAHMIFNVQSQAEVARIAGTNVTLEFTFNFSLTKSSHFGVYLNTQKIDEYSNGAEGDVFVKNTSVLWRITNLKANNSGIYHASVYMKGLAKESSRVKLIVRDEPRSSTGPPMHSLIPTTTQGRSDSGSSYVIVILLVVSPVVLLVAVLPCLIWCLVRSGDKQQEPPPPPPQSSHPTVQETEASKNVHGPSLIYSVLDFPKRPSVVLEINPNDTEYAAVSYLPENRKRV